MTLVLAVVGLLVMHGLDADAITHAAQADAATSSMDPSGTGSPPGLRAKTAEAHGSTPDSASTTAHDVRGSAAPGTHDRAGSLGWGHVVTICVVALATVATGVFRRLVASVAFRAAAVFSPPAGVLTPRSRVFRPPGPNRAWLCVLNC